MVDDTSLQFFIRLPDSLTTSSSIMLQKRNPDAAELVRAKTDRIFGALTTLFIVMKGLPLSYSKDMQEDKEATFIELDSLSLSLATMTGMILTLTVNEDSMRSADSRGFTTATDLADWLVKTLSLPFRQAHHITGELVTIAKNKGLNLDELSLAEMHEVEPRITDEVYKVLDVDNSVASRTSFGGTAPNNIRAAATWWRKEITRTCTL